MTGVLALASAAVDPTVFIAVSVSHLGMIYFILDLGSSAPPKAKTSKCDFYLLWLALQGTCLWRIVIYWPWYLSVPLDLFW